MYLNALKPFQTHEDCMCVSSKVENDSISIVRTTDYKIMFFS